MANPYHPLPDHRFWRKAVAALPAFALDPMVDAPFTIKPTDKVATAGSCFAQEIAARLQGSGYHYYLAEQPPAGMSADEALSRNYAMYSCRYGNIYTAAQLRQLIARAEGTFEPSLDHWMREDGRVIDPFRPRIEPDAFATVEEMRQDRQAHLAAVRRMFETMDVFVFTFGQTETWRHKADGAILPLAPGVAGGEWDPADYEFHNMPVNEVVDEFIAAADRIAALNPRARIIVTVSPVSLMATYEARHILVSNSLSKAVLRAAVDQVVRMRPAIAYFPSYDLCTATPNVDRFYEDDMRSVTPYGVDRVMQVFFAHFTERADRSDRVTPLALDVAAEAASNARVICDEDAIEAA